MRRSLSCRGRMETGVRSTFAIIAMRQVVSWRNDLPGMRQGKSFNTERI